MASILPESINKDQFLIKITHIPTANSVQFHSWLTGFSDAFSSTWAGTPVYGRMDDLYTFTKTSRIITIAFDVVAADEKEARENQYRLNKLTQFLYPVYSNSISPATETTPGGEPVPRARLNSRVLQAAPLLKMKFNALVQDPSNGGELVGFLNGFTYTPNILDGQFFVNKTVTRDMVYQSHNVQLTYNVLHTHLTGWVESTTGTTGDGKALYSFANGDQSNINNGLNVNYPHGGALEVANVIVPIDNNNDGIADTWQTEPGAQAEEAAATQNTVLGFQTPD